MTPDQQVAKELAADLARVTAERDALLRAKSELEVLAMRTAAELDAEEALSARILEDELLKERRKGEGTYFEMRMLEARGLLEECAAVAAQFPCGERARAFLAGTAPPATACTEDCLSDGTEHMVTCPLVACVHGVLCSQPCAECSKLERPAPPPACTCDAGPAHAVGKTWWCHAPDCPARGGR